MGDLLGIVTLHKRIRNHLVWSRSRKDYGFCWVDLLMLANDEPRSVFANGTLYHLKRGQLIWSKQSLAKEWIKSDEWTDSFLKFCQDMEMIHVDANRRRTIITILNYDAYNQKKATDTASEPESEKATDTASEPESEKATDTASEPEQKGEGGKENRKLERARAETKINNFEVSGSGFQKKNPPLSAGPPGRTPAQARYEWGRELEQVSERLDASAELGLPPDPADQKREKELRVELAGLGT